MPTGPDPNSTTQSAPRGTAMTPIQSAWQRLKCTINRHDYASLGMDYKDEVFRCRTCGRRHVEIYTLRIDRLG
jgi:hypothetical protein